MSFIQPGQSFEKFKTEKMKKFDKDKDQKFSKKEVKNILAKTCWWISYHFQLIIYWQWYNNNF